jgi:hypothetical protein
MHECRGVIEGAEAVPHRICREVDVHIKIESALFEPIEYIHGGFVKRERHLIREVLIDLGDDAHLPIENKPRTKVNGARHSRPHCTEPTRMAAFHGFSVS